MYLDRKTNSRKVEVGIVSKYWTSALALNLLHKKFVDKT